MRTLPLVAACAALLALRRSPFRARLALAAALLLLPPLAWFVLIYLALFVLFIYLLDQKIRHGPLADDLEVAYHPR